jgi:hypothetical protein
MRSLNLHVLDEHTVLALGIDHSDGGSSRARPRGFVDKLEPELPSLGQRCRDIVHAQGEVVQAFASPGYEAPHFRLRSQRFQQLDARGTGAKESDANFGKAFVALEAQAEASLEVRPG